MTSLAPTVVHLVRHGEVDNPARILYGRLPGYRLSERGRQMADLVAGALAHERIGLVVASSLQRAQQTAAPVAAAHHLGVRTDDRFIEAGNHFEGSRFGHGRASMSRPRNWPLLLNPLRPSWGEPYRRIAERMCAGVHAARRAVRERYGGGDVVIVSHQLPIWTLRRHLQGRPLWHDPRRRECNLASLTTLTFADDADEQVRSITYTEPAAALYAGADPVPGA